MPYFKNNNVNVLFIHIPKTGGSSLECYFSSKFNIPLNNKSLFLGLKEEFTKYLTLNSSMQHMPYKVIFNNRKLFNINFNNIKIITIVRNPYERIMSDLFYLSKITIDTSKEQVFNIIQTHLSSEPKIVDNHNIPQFNYILDENNKILSNIHILHTETLTNDMHNLGYTDFNTYANSNPNKVNYYDYLNNDFIKLINDFYNLDFEFFNYTKI
jgi:hypothetical protein